MLTRPRSSDAIGIGRREVFRDAHASLTSLAADVGAQQALLAHETLQAKVLQAEAETVAGERTEAEELASKSAKGKGSKVGGGGPDAGELREEADSIETAVRALQAASKGRQAELEGLHRATRKCTNSRMAEVLDLETVYSRDSFERELRATQAELDRQQPQPGPPQEPVFPASWYSRPPMRNSAAIASYRESAGPPLPYGACSTVRPSTVPSGRARGHAATGRGPRPLSSVSASALPPSADAGGSRANTPSLGRRASTPQSAEGGRVPTPQSAPGGRAPTLFSRVSLASDGAASAPNGGGGSGGGDRLRGSASVPTLLRPSTSMATPGCGSPAQTGLGSATDGLGQHGSAADADDATTAAVAWNASYPSYLAATAARKERNKKAAQEASGQLPYAGSSLEIKALDALPIVPRTSLLWKRSPNLQRLPGRKLPPAWRNVQPEAGVLFDDSLQYPGAVQPRSPEHNMHSALDAALADAEAEAAAAATAAAASAAELVDPDATEEEKAVAALAAAQRQMQEQRRRKAAQLAVGANSKEVKPTWRGAGYKAPPSPGPSMSDRRRAELLSMKGPPTARELENILQLTNEKMKPRSTRPAGPSSVGTRAATE